MTTALVLGLLATPSSGVGASVSLESSGVDLDQTAGSSVLPTALSPAARSLLLLRQLAEPGRQTTMRTSEVALGSGGEAYCASARKALRFYRARYVEHRAKMGQRSGAGLSKTRSARNHAVACPRVRFLAVRWQRKARAARLAFESWWRQAPKLSGETWRDVRLDSLVNRNLWRLAVCETGGINGGVPLWTHHNSTYSGALGFAHSTWSHWRHFVRPLPPSVAANASPAEQLAVGRALVRDFGGYSSWPACHRRLGL